jgi:hypothetical protein
MKERALREDYFSTNSECMARSWGTTQPLRAAESQASNCETADTGASVLFVSQAHDGIEVRGEVCGVVAEEQAHSD